MKLRLSFLMAALLLSAAYAAPEFVFVANGNPIQLPPKDAARVTRKLEEIVDSANFNSRDHMAPWFQHELPRWKFLLDIQQGSYLMLRYPEPHLFRTVGGDIFATSVWLPLPASANNPNRAVYPGPVTLVHEGNVIELTKVGGILLIELGLDPAVYPHLPKIIQKTMDHGRRTTEPPPRQE